MMSTPSGQYATDVPDVQWRPIEPLLPAPRWRPKGPGRPPRDRHPIVNGLLYLTKTGCPPIELRAGSWALLPACFGPWKTVYDYFRRWSRHGVWPRVLERLTQQERRRNGRPASAVLTDIPASTNNLTTAKLPASAESRKALSV